MKKISDLKDGIDKTRIVDPIEKLSERMKNNKSKFSLKTVSESQLSKTLRKMKKKKSSGVDGLSQEKFIDGVKVLASPLTKIVNTSILEGCFPSEWREALVTPVLKRVTLNSCQITDLLAVYLWPQSSSKQLSAAK